MSGISPAVVVASSDHHLLDEVIRSLEELPHWRLVASASDLGQLTARCHDGQIQVVLCDGGIAQAWAETGGPVGIEAIVVFGRKPDPEHLLAAIELQAKGFVEWPAQRHRLRDLVERAVDVRSRTRPSGGAMVGLWSPKGGAGTSALAAHLAAALAPRGATVLVDLDIANADQTAIFGAEAHKKDSSTLLRVLDEIGPSMVESVAFRHGSGLDVVLSPGALGGGDMVKPADAVKLAGAISEGCRFLVADLPSSDLELVQSFVEVCSHFYLVVTPDLLGLKRARDAMRAIRSGGARLDRAAVILNRYVRQDVQAGHVEALTGLPVVARVRPDMGLARAAGRGEPSASAERLLAPVIAHVTGEPSPKARRMAFRR